MHVCGQYLANRYCSAGNEEGLSFREISEAREIAEGVIDAGCGRLSKRSLNGLRLKIKRARRILPSELGYKIIKSAYGVSREHFNRKLGKVSVVFATIAAYAAIVALSRSADDGGALVLATVFSLLIITAYTLIEKPYRYRHMTDFFDWLDKEMVNLIPSSDRDERVCHEEGMP